MSGLRFHDLRHNWATRHVECGTDLLALKELGGWRTLEMVQRYAHPSRDYLSVQARNIDAKNKNTEELNNDVETNLLQSKKQLRSKKSSVFATISVRKGNLEVIGEPQKQKNLLNSRFLNGTGGRT